MTSRTRGPERAEDRLRRLLAMLPWVMERGRVAVGDVAARFGVAPDQVVKDLELASLCGASQDPDEMVDLYVEAGIVEVGVPRFFTRPLRLSPREGVALLAAGRAALQVPGADAHGALARALDKLEAALGGPAALDVLLNKPPHLDALEHALQSGEQVRIRYWSAWRDEITERTIEPLHVFADAGRWYLDAYCHAAGGVRRFRVDRIESAELTGEPVAPDRRLDADSNDSRPGPPDDAPVVTLVLPREARWIVETYPVESVEDTADTGNGAHLVVKLRVASPAWLARVLLRAGPGARVSEPASWQDLGKDLAQSVRARYR